MIIILKIILAILAIACGFLFILSIREYKTWFKSQEATEASVMERLLINFMAYVVFASSVCISLSSILLLFSELSVKLPF